MLLVSFNLKKGKYTFSLLFMYFSEMGFMYFSEIYLKLHLSILDILGKSLKIYLSSQNPCYYCYMIGALVHIFLNNFQKTQAKKKPKVEGYGIKCHQWRGNNDCQSLGCWYTPSTFWLSFWIHFIFFYQLFVQHFLFMKLTHIQVLKRIHEARIKCFV